MVVQEYQGGEVRKSERKHDSVYLDCIEIYQI